MDASSTLVKTKPGRHAKSGRRESVFTALPADEFFASLVRRAKEICKMPVALVAHVDEQSSWIVSSVGLDAVDHPEACTDICVAALAQEELMEISDLSLDHHFYDNALVNRSPYLRFFNGLPLLTGDKVIGMLAVFDDQTGGLSYSQRHEFSQLGRVAQHVLDSYRQILPTHRFELGAAIDRDVYLLDADSLDEVYQCHCSTGNGRSIELQTATGSFLNLLASVDLIEFTGLIAPLRAGEKNTVAFDAVFRKPDKVALQACIDISLDLHADANLLIVKVHTLSEDQAHRVDLSALLDSLPATVIYRMHKEQTWITDFVSEGYRTLAGGNPEDVKGNKVAVMRDITHPDDKVRVWSAINTALSAHKPYEVTYRIITAEEETRWVREQGQGSFAKDGQVLAIDAVVFDVTRQQRRSSKLGYQASHDYLTGMCNRREFEKRLIRAVENAQSKSSEHALCFFDLDQFKVINDSCGHRAGDQLLRKLNGVLQSVTRQRDTLARLGGDEFGILMEHCGLPEARRVATLVREGIRDLNFTWEGRAFKLSVSVGIAMVNAQSKDAISVLQMADRSCYAAKKRGGNRIQVYQGDGGIPSGDDESHWIAKINRALDDNRFQLYRQVIVSTATDANTIGSSTSSYEVLLRMVGEDGKSVLPDKFLPAAENYHIAPRIDRWVISQVFSWLANNPAELRDLFLCSINLSGQSLTDEEFPAFLAYQLQRTRVPPEKICFEITETAAITNITRARHFLDILRNTGFRFALDDFGSGLSSFAYLKNLPVDFVKIDGQFVQNMLEDTSDQAVISAITHISHLMGKKVIAEWVENTETRIRLGKLQVDYVQGFGIESPRPINNTVDQQRA